MNHNNQRNTKIVSELMNFCYNNGGKNISIELKSKNDETVIYVKSKIENLSESTLETSKKLLNAPRCREIEAYYWNLTGDNEEDLELTLVGMMVDDASITYDKDTLSIKLLRKS